MKKKIIIGITGASGSLYAKLLLEKLMSLEKEWAEVAVIASPTGKQVWEYELKENFPDEVFQYYDFIDFFAPPASGSSAYDTMIIIPCSMGTMGRIASGVSSDLLLRSADVMLKENRNLIIVPRESPNNLIHIRNMEILLMAGAKIVPASPSFYSLPKTIEELALTVVEKVLQQAGFLFSSFRWGE